MALRRGKGYYPDRSGKYIAKIWEDGVEKHLGMYSSEEEAAEVYNNAYERRLRKAVKFYNHELEDGVIYDTDYLVFENGDIFNTNGHKLKPSHDTKGYCQCLINGRSVKLHRIVGKCFVPNPSNKPEINHIDGNKDNNAAWNLEWTDRLGNIRHAYENGLIKPFVGEQCPNHKLTEQQVDYIRKNHIPRDPEFSTYALARKFGVSQGTVSHIINNRNWRRS